MKRIFVVIGTLIFSLLVIFLSASFANAQTIEGGKNKSVTLAKDAVVDENYFAAGETITVEGTVNGDAYVAGGNVFINGTVNGDLLVAGGMVTIAGTVTGDVRAAGGQINIAGTVNGNITAAGGSLTIAEDATVEGSVVAGTGQLSILAPVGGSLTIGAGNAVIDDTIGGNVLAGVGKLVVSAKSAIKGNLIYYSEEKAQIAADADISGKTTYKPLPDSQKNMEEQRAKAREVARAAMSGYYVYSAVVAFILGAIVIALFPTFFHTANEILHKQPLATMGIGLVAILIVPILIVILMITIIGIPLGFILLAIYMIYLYFAKVMVAMYAGTWIAGQFSWNKSLYLALAIGLVAWLVAVNLPILGFFAHLLVPITGVGMLILTKKKYFHILKGTK